MPTYFKHIYATQAAKYDAMVSCEDYQGNLWTALRQIRDFSGRDVVDVGAGVKTAVAPGVHQHLVAHKNRLISKSVVAPCPQWYDTRPNQKESVT